MVVFSVFQAPISAFQTAQYMVDGRNGVLGALALKRVEWQ